MSVDKRRSYILDAIKKGLSGELILNIRTFFLSSQNIRKQSEDISEKVEPEYKDEKYKR